MGFKLKYGTINKGNFTFALDKLANAAGLPVKAAYNVGKIHARVQSELQEGRKIFQTIVSKYGEKDEKGVLKYDEQGMFIIPEANQKDFDAETQSMMDIEFEMPFSRIEMPLLERVGLSGKELLALEPIMVTFDVIEGGAGKPEVTPQTSA